MASLQSDMGDSSPQPITSQHRGSGPKFKKRPVYATCPECEKSAMTVVEKEQSGCCSTCLAHIILFCCCFSVLCGIFAILSDDKSCLDDNSCLDNAVDLPADTYLHKCSSCDKEIARYRH